MKIRLNYSQKKYLIEKVLKKYPLLVKKIKNLIFEKADMVEIDIDPELASEIRDICLEQFDIIGFDENYEPNEDGKMLESLSDILYLGSK